MLIDKERQIMSRPIKTIQVNAPLRNDQYDKTPSPETFTKFLFIPEYRAAQQNWPKHEIHFEVILTKETVNSDYFLGVNNVLKKECTELLTRYVLVKK